MPPSNVSFIVPTLKRVSFLRRCLAAIDNQSVSPAEVLVGVRLDDSETVSVLAREVSMKCPVERVEAKGIGVIGSMSSCLSVATGRYIALVDDDVELPSHWLERMLAHLNGRAEVVAAAGRDLLQDHPAMRRNETLVLDVGRIHWSGRITGNHHRGGGVARKVQLLRGSNVLFRGDFLRTTGFEQGLRGGGAQVNWELALAYQAAAAGKTFVYDPAVGVIHHVAPREDNDLVHRGKPSMQGVSDIAFNETYVTVRHAPPGFKLPVLAWQWLVGTCSTPGLLNAIRLLTKGTPEAWPCIRASVSGRWAAMRVGSIRFKAPPNSKHLSACR